MTDRLREPLAGPPDSSPHTSPFHGFGTVMTRRFIEQLGEHESVDEVFLVADKQLRTNRNGNLYLQLRLSDRTGSVPAMLWNVNDQMCASFDHGDYVRVQATTQFYNGALQMIAQRVERVDGSAVDESDFLTLATADMDRLAARLARMLREMKHYHLRCLAECFLVDEAFMDKFLRRRRGPRTITPITAGCWNMLSV